ncbi:MAG: hypothetical protein FJ357_01905 [Thaumarchaeota archaeon]|nr:hypothetical protein [Nitrososphaerota archaeon]
MKIDQIDLAFLHLAASHNDRFNEQDIAGSDLAYLGVGRTLDKLAHLKESNLIQLDGESFRITDAAKKIFWDKDTPLQTRILRLLQVKSFEESDIARYLLEELQLLEKIDDARKQGLLIFTTVKKDEKIIKVCEITQEGNEFLQVQSLDPKSQLEKSLQDISIKIQTSKLDNAKIKEILDKIQRISTELD